MTEQPKRKPGRPRKERPEDDKFNGAPASAFDHDGDGHAGGSLHRTKAEQVRNPDGERVGDAGADQRAEYVDAAEGGDIHGREDGLAKSSPVINLHEQTAIVREAWEAYDMQDDRVRFDSAGRKWVLRMDNSSGHWELSLHLSRGLHEASDSVSQIVLGSSSGYEAVEKAVKLLDGAVT